MLDVFKKLIQRSKNILSKHSSKKKHKDLPYVFYPNPQEGHLENKQEEPVIDKTNLHSQFINRLPYIQGISWDKPLGNGAFGLVYKAHDNNQDIDIAVKKINLNNERGHHSLIEGVFNDCRTQIELGLHPNIANCYYIKTYEGNPYIFMEYASEGSLKTFIKNGKIDSLSLLLQVAYQTAIGLHYIHINHYIHQDIKPSNVLISPIEESILAQITGSNTDCMIPFLVKIADFNTISKTNDHGWNGWAVFRKGDIQFASPNQFIADDILRRANESSRHPTVRIDWKEDLWEWAVLVLNMFYGPSIPWLYGKDAPEFLEKYYKNYPSNPNQIQMPEKLYKLLRRCFSSGSESPENMQVVYKLISEIHMDLFDKLLPEINVGNTSLSAIGYNNQGVSYFNLTNFNFSNFSLTIDCQRELVRLATTSFENALKYDPNHLTTIYNIALLHWATGEIPDDLEFVRTIEHHLKNQLDVSYGYYLLGRAHIHRLHPEEAINALEESLRHKPDSKIVKDYLENIQNNKKLFPNRLALMKDHTNVECVNISRDGSRVIMLSDDKIVSVWDLKTDHCIAKLATSCIYKPVLSLSFKGTVAAYESDKGIIAVWELATKKKISTLKIYEGEKHHSNIECIAFLRNSDFIISSVTTYTEELYELIIWNHCTGQRIHTIQAHTGRINSLVISEDLQYLVTTSDDNTAKIWEFNNDGCDITSEPIAVIHGKNYYTEPEKVPHNERDRIYFADIDSTNSYIITAAKNGTINQYDLSTKKIIRSLHGHTEIPRCVRWISGTLFAISTSRSEIKIWDMNHGTCLSTFPYEEGYVSSSFELAGSLLVLLSNNTIDVWNISKIVPISLQSGLLFDDVEKALERINLSKQEMAQITRIEMLINQESTEPAYQALKQFNLKYPRLKHHSLIQQLSVRLGINMRKNGVDEIWYDYTFAWKDMRFGSNLSCLDISQDSKKVVAASIDGIIFVADILHKRISSLLHYNNVVGGICFVGSDQALIGTAGETVELLELGSLKTRDTFSYNDTQRTINALDYCEQTNQVVFSASSFLSGGYLVVYDLSTKEILLEQKHDFFYQGSDSFFFNQGLSVCFSPDGHYLLVGENNGNITLWDLSKKRKILIISEHKNSVEYVRFFQVGKAAISVGNDNIIRFWNLKYGYCFKSINNRSGKIKDVCLTSDESYLIVLNEANEINMWNLDTFQCDKTYTPDIPIKLHLIDITPDGQYIIAGGQDRQIYTFGVDWIYEFTREPVKSERQPRKLFLADGSEIEPVLGLNHSSDITTLELFGLRYLVSGSFDCKVKIWDLFNDGVCINTLEGHCKRINAIITSSKNDQIITASDDGTAIVWSFNSGIIQQTLKHLAPVKTLAMDGTQDILVTGCEDCSIHIWELKTGRELKTLSESWNIETVVISSQGKYLVVGTDNGDIQVRRICDLELIKTIHENTDKIVKIVEHQNQLYIGYSSGTISIINLNTLESVNQLVYNVTIGDLYINENCLFICNYSFNNGSILIIDLATYAIKTEIKGIGRIRAIAPYIGGYCFIGMGRGAIFVANTNTGKLDSCISGLNYHPLCVKISLDKHFIIAGYYNCFCIYDLQIGKLYKFEDDRNIIDVDFSIDNKYAYAKNYIGEVYQYDLEKDCVVKKYFIAHLGTISTAVLSHISEFDTFDPDTFLLVVRNEKGILVFREVKISEIDLQSKIIDDLIGMSNIRYLIDKPLENREFSSQSEGIFIDLYKKGEQIKFEQENIVDLDKSIIVGDSGLIVTLCLLDNTIKVRDIKTHEIIQTIADNIKQDHISAIALYSENILIAGYYNGKIKLWNLHTAELLSNFEAHTGQVSSISVSPTRDLIISGGDDGIKIWSIDDNQLLAYLVNIKYNDYVIATPQNEFYVSNQKLLQFYHTSNIDGTITRTLVSEEERRKEYLSYFVNIGLIRSSI